MRIVAGNLKGITLYGPKNKKIRPLKDMVRESIFNFLAHSNKISSTLEQSNVLDLYSGTGSFGLECVSRQAAKVVFIEKEKEAVKILEKNIEKLKAKDGTKIFSNDVFHAGTYIKNNKTYSIGGRVLNVTSASDSLIEARNKSLDNINKINWVDGFFRRDIGWRIINNK